MQAVLLTVALKHAVGEEEGQDIEEHPQAQLQHRVAVVQLLVTLVALVLDTQQRQ